MSRVHSPAEQEVEAARLGLRFASKDDELDAANRLWRALLLLDAEGDDVMPHFTICSSSMYEPTNPEEHKMSNSPNDELMTALEQAFAAGLAESITDRPEGLDCVMITEGDERTHGYLAETTSRLLVAVVEYDEGFLDGEEKLVDGEWKLLPTGNYGETTRRTFEMLVGHGSAHVRETTNGREEFCSRTSDIAKAYGVRVEWNALSFPVAS